MVDAKIIEWRKKEGEAVEKGETLCVIETEKITFEIEAPSSGILGKILVPQGEIRPVGEVLAYICKPGEKMDEISVHAKLEEKGEETVDADSVKSDRMSVQVEEKKEPAKMRKKRIRISPLARKVAEEHDVDISGITGTGPGGLINKKDVLKIVEEAKSGPVESEKMAGEFGPTKGKILPLSGMRLTIARRLSESFRTPHFWVEAQADATKLRETREQLMASVEVKTGQRLTYTDLFVKMVAQAVGDYPMVNSKWADNGIEILEEINIGVATSVDDGLIVPVIRHADKKSVAEIAEIRVDIVSRGRQGRLGIDEMTGSTITITNLGMADVERGFPILNPPEAAILGIAAIKERPFAVKGEVVARLSTNLTLGIDHRVLDGFIASQFLNRVKDLIEEPLLLL
jgi:pyruvate dehydrogenase E2 component (dihydrolipoamide acetyltransferase)